MNRVLAVDPSLTSTGWVLFDIEQNKPVFFDVIKPPGTELALSARYGDLQQEIERLFTRLELGDSDYLVCEGPAPLVKNPESALRVERVRGIFEAVARFNGLQVLERLNPRTVQSEVLGLKGKQIDRATVKDLARSLAEQLFPDVFKERKKLSQDIVDALLIGSLAVSRLQLHLKTGVEVEILFAKKQRRRSGDNYRGW